jgi:hypothetical protein
MRRNMFSCSVPVISDAGFAGRELEGAKTLGNRLGKDDDVGCVDG